VKLAWLKENRYAPDHVALCWGDARIGNTLYSRTDRNVLAVMDWEMAFIGDPESDLAWFFVLDKGLSKGYGLPPLEGYVATEAKELAEATPNRLLWYLVPPIDLVSNLRKAFR
jgi:aminoglycoside phosphotransferase (APT) family kinase protein